MNEKTHYRRVFKSEHLGIADLEDFQEEGKPLVFTISHVTQHVIIPQDKNSGVAVAGRRISANIAHFIEEVKPLVLNATNSKAMSKITGSVFVQQWQNVKVELYVNASVKMKGETVGGVRIKAGISLTKEVLEALFSKKRDKVAPTQLEGIERVLLEDEVNSYSKVHKYLTGLK